MKTLFHLTWASNIPSILADGLRPNHAPNRWALDTATRRSRRHTFLCTRERLAYWDMIYGDGWVQPPAHGDTLVSLEVRVPASWLMADSATVEQYEGDFKCGRLIPAANLSVVGSLRALLKAA